MDTSAAFLLIFNRVMGMRYEELYKTTMGPWSLATHMDWRDVNGVYQDVLTAAGSVQGGSAKLSYDGSGTPKRLNAPSVDQAFGYWAAYEGVIELTPMKEKQMMDAAQSGRNVVGSQLEQVILKGVETIFEEIKTDFAGSAGTGAADNAGIAGIVDLVAETGTLHGINRGTVTSYACYVNDNSGTPRALTRALIQDVVRTMVETRGGRPDMLVMSPTQFFLIADDSDAHIHNAVQVSISPDQAQQMTRLNMGFVAGTYTVPGATLQMIVEPDHPTNRVDILTKADFLVQHYMHQNFMPYLRQVTTEGGKRLFYIAWSGQSFIRNPFKSAGAVTDLTTS